MRKNELNNLVAGSKVMDKRNNTILEVVGLDKEQGKYILSNGKCYSQSTMYRWFDLQVEEVEQPMEEKTVEEKVEDKPVEPIEPTITVEKTVVDENHEDHTETSDSTVLAGENSRDELNNILITHNCYLKKMKQYEAVRSDRTTGTLIYIRFAKEGGYHFDVSQKTWSKLTKDYASWLIENFGACIKDKTRKLYRISCNNLEIFQVLLLTALS